MCVAKDEMIAWIGRFRAEQAHEANRVSRPESELAEWHHGDLFLARDVELDEAGVMDGAPMSIFVVPRAPAEKLDPMGTNTL